MQVLQAYLIIFKIIICKLEVCLLKSFLIFFVCVIYQYEFN
jgi:hypothetical protein